MFGVQFDRAHRTVLDLFDDHRGIGDTAKPFGTAEIGCMKEMGVRIGVIQLERLFCGFRACFESCPAPFLVRQQIIGEIEVGRGQLNEQPGCHIAVPQPAKQRCQISFKRLRISSRHFIALGMSLRGPEHNSGQRNADNDPSDLFHLTPLRHKLLNRSRSRFRIRVEREVLTLDHPNLNGWLHACDLFHIGMGYDPVVAAGEAEHRNWTILQTLSCVHL